jgi:hypothetical protein
LASSQPAGAALLMAPQGQLGLGGSVGLLAGQQRRRPIGPGWRHRPGPAKHPPPPTRLAVVGGELLQDLLGLDPPEARLGKLPGPVAGGLVQQDAEPVALGPQLAGGELSRVQGAGGVDRQALLAGPREDLGKLLVAVGQVAVGQVQLGRALGFGTDHRVQGGLVPGAGQLDIQPVGVLAAGQPHQGPPAGEALGAMPAGGIGEVDAAVALAPAAAVQIPARQAHLTGVLAVHSDRQGASLGVQGRDGPAGAVGHSQLPNRVAAAHDPVSDRELAIPDLEPLGPEAAPGGQQLLAGHIEPIHLGPPAGQHDHVLGGVLLGLLPGLPPVLEQGQGGGWLGLGADDPVVGPVGGHRLVHHQHRPIVQLLAAAVEVDQEAVTGGRLLEPLGLHGDGGDPGGRGGPGPVAVELPGMAGHPQGEGLARAGPAHDQGDAGTALTDVVHHCLLVLDSGGMGS